jgi:regulator of PEP synthase PpsR (kinase-PPPase family)
LKRGGQKKIYLISDSTGELGERFTNAILSQFPNDDIVLEKFSFVSGIDEVKAIFPRTLKNSVLFHTVLSGELKRAIRKMAGERGVPAFDLTGPPADFVVRHLKATPVWDAHAIHRLDADYNKRINAIEFAIAHDDGAGEATFGKADVILVGPSRSSKTPVSMYLAVKGVRVANIPLIPEIGIPARLAQLKDGGRVFCFLIRPDKLFEIRRKRVPDLGTDAGAYSTLSGIRKELRWVESACRTHRWRTIDVTDRAIEETAVLILKQLS